jgi:hypothetical protein
VTQTTGLSNATLMTLEYERIKDEQKTRIGFRDNLLYATIAATAAVLTATMSAHSKAYLLLMPPVSVILGWTYLVNDEKISAIGRYVRMELAPQLAVLTGDSTPIFGWENAHRNDRRRVSRKYSQLVVDLVTFCVTPTVAIAVFWSSPSVPAMLMVASLAEIAFVGSLFVQIVLYADLKG